MVYDPVKAAEYATKAMNATSLSKCALYIRKAINAGGIPGSWGHAYQFLEKDAGGLNPLERMGFNLIDHNQGLQVGDIGVLNRTKDHEYGHIQMWNGKQWVSDFGQDPAKMGPYRKYANGIAPGQTLRVFRYGVPAAQIPANTEIPIEAVSNSLDKTGPTITQTNGLSNLTQNLTNPSESNMPVSNPRGIQPDTPQGIPSSNIWEDLNRSFKYFEPMKPSLNLGQGLFGGGLRDLSGRVMNNPFSNLFRRF